MSTFNNQLRNARSIKSLIKMRTEQRFSNEQTTLLKEKLFVKMARSKVWRTYTIKTSQLKRFTNFTKCGDISCNFKIEGRSKIAEDSKGRFCEVIVNDKSDMGKTCEVFVRFYSKRK